MKRLIVEIKQQIHKLLRQGSNPVSATLRLLCEAKSWRRWLGTQILAVTLSSSVIALPIHAFDYANTRPQFVDGTVFVPVTTETTYQFPVIRAVGISQGYGRFHPAIDVRAPRGSEVVAIADGIVISASYTSTGYGKHIRLAHDGQVVTLYAHLDTMLVKAGEQVTKGQQIGTIGMTGWTTGPHLHFELTQEAKYLDPMTVVRETR